MPERSRQRKSAWQHEPSVSHRDLPCQSFPVVVSPGLGDTDLDGDVDTSDLTSGEQTEKSFRVSN